MLPTFAVRVSVPLTPLPPVSESVIGPPKPVTNFPLASTAFTATAKNVPAVMGSVIGVIPQGGNVVDAALLDGRGKQLVDDHFGELAMVYGLGRTCEPTRLEVIRDGAGGGVAALRAIGKTGNDDFINLKGMGVLPVSL